MIHWDYLMNWQTTWNLFWNNVNMFFHTMMKFIDYKNNLLFTWLFICIFGTISTFNHLDTISKGIKFTREHQTKSYVSDYCLFTKCSLHWHFMIFIDWNVTFTSESDHQRSIAIHSISLMYNALFQIQCQWITIGSKFY